MKWVPDFDAERAIERAESDPEQAAEVLRIAATYLRKGESLPEILALHLAEAIEASMGKPQPHRGKALLRELHLQAENRRHKAYWDEVGMYMQVHMDRTTFRSLNEAITGAAVHFDISEATARRCYRKYKKIRMTELEEDDRLVEEHRKHNKRLI